MSVMSPQVTLGAVPVTLRMRPGTGLLWLPGRPHLGWRRRSSFGAPSWPPHRGSGWPFIITALCRQKRGRISAKTTPESAPAETLSEERWAAVPLQSGSWRGCLLLSVLLCLNLEFLACRTVQKQKSRADGPEAETPGAQAGKEHVSGAGSTLKRHVYTCVPAARNLRSTAFTVTSKAWHPGAPGGSVGGASDFGSGHDLAVDEFEPRVGPCADGSEPGARFGICVSLCLCPSPTYALLCLSKYE